MNTDATRRRRLVRMTMSGSGGGAPRARLVCGSADRKIAAALFGPAKIDAELALGSGAMKPWPLQLFRQLKSFLRAFFPFSSSSFAARKLSNRREREREELEEGERGEDSLL